MKNQERSYLINYQELQAKKEDRQYKRGVTQNPNGRWSIGHKVQYVMEKLTEKCTNIQIQKQLKQNKMSFCKKLYIQPNVMITSKINQQSDIRNEDLTMTSNTIT